jgi:4a-hydroxytetrahydrobiopterin dehydratase
MFQDRRDQALDWAIVEEPLTRHEASGAVTDLGWRYVLGVLRTSVPVESFAAAVDVAGRAAAACGPDADRHLFADVRPDRAILTLQTLAAGSVRQRDIDLAHRISAALRDAGRVTEPGIGYRAVQVIEIAIDAMDIPSVRPFWKAVMGYAAEAGNDGPKDPLIDPLGQGPAIWFQQMDQPRPQRNRIHIDVSVPHDEAQRRIEATIEAGGTIRSDKAAPAFWVLADPEGNEACVTTWQGRD